MSTSAPSAPSSDAASPANRHNLSAVERQRAHLDKLLKDPAKPAYIPPAPKDKTLRPAREMMKNVQGSSAGAGSGEFHVYKASRRREYERLELLEEAARKEVEEADFKRKRAEQEAIAEAKTAKNRAKRQKKKERGRNAASEPVSAASKDGGAGNDVPFKKRRLVNGQEIIFKKQTEEEESDEAEENAVVAPVALAVPSAVDETQSSVAASRVIIHEDD